MKNSKTYLLPLIMTSLLLAACATVPVGENQSMQPDQSQIVGDSLSSSDQATAMPDQGTAAVGPEAVMQSRYGQKMSCDLLADQNEREACLARVNDVIGMSLENEIMSSFDLSRCKLFPEEMAADCQRRLEETGVKGPISAEDRVALQTALQPVFPQSDLENATSEAAPVQPYYDSKLCQSLQADGLREYCERAIAERLDQQKMSEIIAAGEIDGCEQLSQENYREQCRMVLGAPQEPVSPDLIEEIPSDMLNEEALVLE